MLLQSKTSYLQIRLDEIWCFGVFFLAITLSKLNINNISSIGCPVTKKVTIWIFDLLDCLKKKIPLCFRESFGSAQTVQDTIHVFLF